MLENLFPPLLLLLSVTFVIVLIFQRLRIPSSLAYLLVGLILGEYTPGPVIDDQPVRALAEFGIVFLLFSIGLNFSLPQLYALRHTLLGVGTSQVVFTTLIVGVIVWLLGLPAAAAFVVGAVFAQSSTTIISKQLAEQHEQNTGYGREAVAMSVFQDITAVPFVVVIPVLATAAGSVWALGNALGLAFAKAALAFAIVFVGGKWLLRPLFRMVTQSNSSELFTLSVLTVSLLAGAVSYTLGLSMAFGAFLAGMVLGETEFRHQVESVIRPFKDVLLGLFFIGIGMMVNPRVLPDIWHLALLGTLLLLISKAVIVAGILKYTGKSSLRAWRTGWLVAVGGEFGFALLAIALSVRLIDQTTSQIVLTSVLFSMIVAPFMIRYNEKLARFCASLSLSTKSTNSALLPTSTTIANTPAIVLEQQHVVLCGYGTHGESIGEFLKQENIPFLALDINSAICDSSPLAGQQVFYGDASEVDMLQALSIAQAKLAVITYSQEEVVLQTIKHIRALAPQLPIMVQTRQHDLVNVFKEAGATEVIADDLEVNLMLAAHALLLLGIPTDKVLERLKQQWQNDYPVLKPLFHNVL